MRSEERAKPQAFRCNDSLHEFAVTKQRASIKHWPAVVYSLQVLLLLHSSIYFANFFLALAMVAEAPLREMALMARAEIFILT